jgi:hypothetical protein
LRRRNLASLEAPDVELEEQAGAQGHAPIEAQDAMLWRGKGCDPLVTA